MSVTSQSTSAHHGLTTGAHGVVCSQRVAARRASTNASSLVSGEPPNSVRTSSPSLNLRAKSAYLA